MTCHSHPPKPPSSFEGCPCMKSPSLRESMYRSWSELVPRCGGCIAPRMTIRLLGSFVLVSGVMVSSAEGSLFVREEQRYRRCLLQQQGLVGDRHMTQQLEKGKAQDILECYPYNIHFIRGCSGMGVVLLLLLILATLLMFVAVATDRWRLTLPWAHGCTLLIIQELILVAGCWELLGLGDLVLYAIHIILLSYSAMATYAMLKLVQHGAMNQEYSRQV
ncbi:uncharacterized protein [Macrobrachium rosenbergii]|uniref:uncharacterized protein isoform X1 n=1 Tax=Macrobrachium rosenbergii TaxID=79674 RepID=UPI0034D4EE1D